MNQNVGNASAIEYLKLRMRGFINDRVIPEETTLLAGGDAARDAMAALDKDFTPIDDHRASAAYRMLAARNLFYRFYLESSETATTTRLPGLGSAGHG